MTWASHLRQLELERQQGERDRIVQLISSLNNDKRPKSGSTVKCPGGMWKECPGASATEIAGLEEFLAMNRVHAELPSDYKAFLKLNHETHSSRAVAPLHRSRRAYAYVDATMMTSSMLLRAIIGDVTCQAIRKEMEQNKRRDVLMHAVTMDAHSRRYLISPNACRTAADFWLPLLSDLTLPKKLRRDAREFSANHFGPVSILEKMKSWTTWLVLDRGVRDETGAEAPPRIYSSFTHMLEDAVVMQKERERDAEKDKRGESEWDDARFAAWDRCRWEPFLESYPPSLCPLEISRVRSKRYASRESNDWIYQWLSEIRQ
ncbi:hypothetical protein GGR53DRAFT_345030 [Hypoxylon sp. FL1150]|nr:hypothetical protein GGR53DRAFT_345030 [Hypoxylon sp. FL1150]